MPSRPKTNRGRPAGITLTQAMLAELIAQVDRTLKELQKSADFMRENRLPQVTMLGAKVLTEHAPIVESFAKKLYQEVGPALTSLRLGLPTRLEQNQERYKKAKKNRPR